MQGTHLARALAREYSSQVYADPFDAVQDYRQVLAYADDHPEKGYHAIATALDLPNSRVEGWVDNDSQPPQVKAIQAAHDYGWLPFRLDEPTGRGLSVLCAWIAGGGSLGTVNRVPSWVVQPEDAGRWLTRAATHANVDLSQFKQGTSVSYRPSEDSGLLGRFMTALGVHVGKKSAEAPTTLPWYLRGAPRTVRKEYAQVVIHLRGDHDDPRPSLTLREHRSDPYNEALVGLLETVLDGEVSMGDRQVTLSPAAAEEYRQWAPPLGDVST